MNKHILKYFDFINEELKGLKLYFISLSNDITHITTSTGKNLNQQIDNYILNNIWDEYDYIQHYKPEEVKVFVDSFVKGSVVYSFKPVGVYKTKDTPDRLKTKAFYEALQKRKDELHVFMNKSTTASKVESQKLFGKFEFFPKAVYKKEDIDDIGWPVVAKPDFGHSGVGIQKFDNEKELNKYLKENPKAKFDLFCEMIEFEREFRAIFVNNKVAYIAERVPKIEKNININTKSASDAMQFVYVPQNIEEFKYIEEIEKISEDVLSVVDLTVYSIDFFLTKKKKIKLIEVNAQTGLNPYAMISLYRTLYSEVFKQDIPIEKDGLLIKLENIFLNDDYQTFKKEIESSLQPVNYKDIKIDKELKKEIEEKFADVKIKK